MMTIDSNIPLFFKIWSQFSHFRDNRNVMMSNVCTFFSCEKPLKRNIFSFRFLKMVILSSVRYYEIGLFLGLILIVIGFVYVRLTLNSL